MRPLVAILNASHALANDEAERIAAALQVQVDRDFAAYYGLTATLVFVPFGGQAPLNAWQLILLDNSDVAGALGYHDVTRDGLPLGKAFVGTDLKYGYKPSVTISHELLEMLGDPAINQTVFIQSGQFKGRIYAYEVCDAVEADALGYDIDGVTVSDFVTPAWFQPFPNAGPYSFRQNVIAPFELAAGGYIGVFDAYGRGWRQLTADKRPPTSAAFAAATFRNLPPLGSRRERRARWWHGGDVVWSTA